MKLLLAIAAFGITLSSIAHADQISGLKGKCTQLVVEDADITSQCLDGFISTSYSEGNINLSFGTQDGPTVTFIGQAQPKIDENTESLIINRIYLTKGEAEPMVIRSLNGACTITDPTKGVAKINCVGKNEEGKTSIVRFTTDGNPPL